MSSDEGVTGTFEIHIFVLPLNPSLEVAEAFTVACRGSGAAPRMKGLLLYLDYEDQGFVGVLQSSRYVTGTLADAERGAEEDATILRNDGFEVVRKKIEALTTNDHVPQRTSPACAHPDRYFEFHLLIRDPRGPISNEEVASLRRIASDMRRRLKRPVPLSYNALKPGQRFLNLRARDVGLDDALMSVRDLERLVAETGDLEVAKVISEYIVSDDNRALDQGWLEPKPSPA